MDGNTIIWIVAIIIGILGIIFAASKKEKILDQSKWLFAGIFIAIAVVLVAMQLGYLSQFGLSPLAAGVPTPTPDTPIPDQTTPSGICAIEDTTVTLSSVNKYTNAPTGGTHRYRIGNQAAKTVSDAGTFTASPGDKLNILYGNGTSGTYFSEVREVTIPCKGTFNPSEISPVQLVENGTVTINVFNEEGNLISAAGENETLGAGDVANLKVELRATNKKGAPYGGILLIELNGSDFDEENTELSFGDLTVSPASTPNVHDVTNISNKVVAYEIGAFEGAALHTGTLTLDVDDNNDPGQTNDPKVIFRPYDYFVNEDTGGSYDGPAVEDEDNVATFTHITTFTVQVD